MFAALANAMNPEQYGTMTMSFSAAIFIASWLTLGQHILVLAKLPPLLHNNKTTEAAEVVKRNYKYMQCGAVIFMAASILPTATLALYSAHNAILLILTATLAVTYAYSEYSSYYLRALGKPILATLPRDILWRLSILAFAIHHTTPMQSAPGCISTIFFILLSLTTVLFLQRLFRGKLPLAHDRAKTPKISFIDWKSTSFNLSLASIATVITGQASILVVGIATSPNAAGDLFSIQRASLLLTLPLLGTNLLLSPQISKWHITDPEKLKQSIRQTHKLLILPTLASYCALMYFADRMTQAFNINDPDLTLSLRILASASLYSCLCGPTGQILLLSGRETTFIRLLASNEIICLIATAGLAVLFNTLGAAIALAAGTITLNTIIAYVATKHMGIDPTALLLLTPQPKATATQQPMQHEITLP